MTKGDVMILEFFKTVKV